MRACWVFVILVGCRLSHATQSPNCDCDQLQYFCVPVGGNVTLPCPVLDGDDLLFNLFHAKERICNHTSSHKNNAKNCHAAVELQRENNSVGFKLTGVNSSSYGVYRCEGKVMYPPPLKIRNQWTLVHKEGHQCHTGRCEKSAKQNCGYHWIWILALVSTYSITITIIAITVWIKLRRTDTQSDYMNTKPKPPRDRKKKRGVQIPIQRHF